MRKLAANLGKWMVQNDFLCSLIASKILPQFKKINIINIEDIKDIEDIDGNIDGDIDDVLYDALINHPLSFGLR